MSITTRLFGASFAVAMLGASLVGAGSADAAAATPHHAVITVYRADAAPQPSARKPARQIDLIGTKTGRVTFRLHGHVKPRYRHQMTLLQYTATKRGAYHVIRSHKTNAKSAYEYKFVSKPGFYRIKVKASHGFRTSYSASGHIYRV